MHKPADLPSLSPMLRADCSRPSRLAKHAVLTGRWGVGAAAFFALAVGGCDAPAPRSTAPATASAEAPIIEGSADTEHPAVVWLFNSDDGFACSGTIIAVDGTTGYVLTAAHCAGMDQVVIATDFYDCFGEPRGPSCQAVFAAQDQVYHPTWTGDIGEGSADFSMLRFVGAGPTTPVIPAAASDDGVFPTVEVDVVGFGQIETGDNSRRNHKVTRIDEVIDEPALFSHPATVCFGDSGGPAILDGRVVGVSSFVDSDSCYGHGYSGRVQTVYEDFIAPYIAQPPIQQSCDACLETALDTLGGPCGAELDACGADSACVAIEACVIACVGNPGCERECANSNPAGALLHDAIFRCASCDVCVSSCGDDPRCHAPSPTTSVGAGPASTGATPIGLDGVGSGGGGGGGDGTGDGTGADDDGDGCNVAVPGAPTSRVAIGFIALAVGLGLRRRTPARR